MAEKMSKSRGNVVRPEEVVYGVHELAGTHEFRTLTGDIIEDLKECGVWQDMFGNGCFYTSTCHGKHPVMLHERGNEVPCIIVVQGKEILQHPEQVVFWDMMKNYLEYIGAPL